MIKRELKVNFKSFIIWLGILIGLFLLVFMIYPFILTDEAVTELDEMLKIFPPEVLKAFNMDISSISTAYGWLKTEGFMFVLIIIGLYSSVLGSSIVLKEESDKTIEYLSSLPIKRNNIMTNKVIVAIIYMILIVLSLGLFNYIALLLSGDFNQKEYFLLSISPLLIALPLFSINLFIATFLHKTKKTIGISLGIVFISYLLSMLGELSKEVEVLKYFSIYTLADTRNVITNCSINPVVIIISILLSAVFITLSYVRYNNKELMC